MPAWSRPTLPLGPLWGPAPRVSPAPRQHPGRGRTSQPPQGTPVSHGSTSLTGASSLGLGERLQGGIFRVEDAVARAWLQFSAPGRLCGY